MDERLQEFGKRIFDLIHEDPFLPDGSISVEEDERFGIRVQYGEHTSVFSKAILIEAEELLEDVAETVVQEMKDAVRADLKVCNRCRSDFVAEPDYLCLDCRHGPVATIDDTEDDFDTKGEHAERTD